MAELNRSQREIQKAARDFAKGEFDRDLALEMETAGQFPEAIWKKAASLGFLGAHFPEAVSGGGMGMMDTCLIAEEFCRRDSSIGLALGLAAHGTECLVRFGDPALRDTFVPPVVEGETLAACAFTEPECGWNLTGVTASAVRDGDQWIVNGAKSHVLNGGAAGATIVLCRTDAGAPPDKGLSMILVEGDRNGVAAVGTGRKLGGNMLATADMTFSHVAVPAGHLIGRAGRGLAQAHAFFEEAAVQMAAMAVGVAAGAFDRALAYVKEREQFGRKLAVFEITRIKIADMATTVEQARQITYAAARAFDTGKAAGSLADMARLTACRAAVAVADESIQLFGGYGYMKESEVERFYRDAKIADLSLGGATRFRYRIADRLIGKLR